MQLSPRALAWATAIFAAACWFIAMVFSFLTGVGQMTLTTIGAYHPFFSYSFGGMIIIVIENLIAGYILGWIFAWLYDKFVK